MLNNKDLSTELLISTIQSGTNKTQHYNKQFDFEQTSKRLSSNLTDQEIYNQCHNYMTNLSNPLQNCFGIPPEALINDMMMIGYQSKCFGLQQMPFTPHFYPNALQDCFFNNNSNNNNSIIINNNRSNELNEKDLLKLNQNSTTLPEMNENLPLKSNLSVNLDQNVFMNTSDCLLNEAIEQCTETNKQLDQFNLDKIKTNSIKADVNSLNIGASGGSVTSNLSLQKCFKLDHLRDVNNNNNNNTINRTNFSLDNNNNKINTIPDTCTYQQLSHNRKTDEDFCDLCQKHFCNKYYLRKHKTDVHGIQSEPYSHSRRRESQHHHQQQPSQPQHQPSLTKVTKNDGVSKPRDKTKLFNLFSDNKCAQGSMLSDSNNDNNNNNKTHSSDNERIDVETCQQNCSTKADTLPNNTANFENMISAHYDNNNNNDNNYELSNKLMKNNLISEQLMNTSMLQFNGIDPILTTQYYYYLLALSSNFTAQLASNEKSSTFNIDSLNSSLTTAPPPSTTTITVTSAAVITTSATSPVSSSSFSMTPSSAVKSSTTPTTKMSTSTETTTLVLPSPIETTNSELDQNMNEYQCELCQKVFCNEYFLKLHELNHHKCDELKQNKFNQLRVSEQNQKTSDHLRSKKQQFTDSEHRATANDIEKTGSTTELDAIKSDKDGTKPSINGHFELDTLDELYDDSVKSADYCPDDQLLDPELPNYYLGSNYLDVFKSTMTAAKLSDRVICDLCNKELCNKYFLRTHKIRVHGVSPREISSASSSNQLVNDHNHHYRQQQQQQQQNLTTTTTATTASSLDRTVTHVNNDLMNSFNQHVNTIGFSNQIIPFNYWLMLSQNLNSDLAYANLNGTPNIWPNKAMVTVATTMTTPSQSISAVSDLFTNTCLTDTKTNLEIPSAVVAICCPICDKAIGPRLFLPSHLHIEHSLNPTDPAFFMNMLRAKPLTKSEQNNTQSNLDFKIDNSTQLMQSDENKSCIEQIERQQIPTTISSTVSTIETTSTATVSIDCQQAIESISSGTDQLVQNCVNTMYPTNETNTFEDNLIIKELQPFRYDLNFSLNKDANSIALIPSSIDVISKDTTANTIPRITTSSVTSEEIDVSSNSNNHSIILSDKMNNYTEVFNENLLKDTSFPVDKASSPNSQPPFLTLEGIQPVPSFGTSNCPALLTPVCLGYIPQLGTTTIPIVSSATQSWNKLGILPMRAESQPKTSIDQAQNTHSINQIGLPRKSPNQMRVLCDICNKWICNKYFLRTHKANKHGVTELGTNSFEFGRNNNNNNIGTTTTTAPTTNIPATSTTTDIVNSKSTGRLLNLNDYNQFTQEKDIDSVSTINNAKSNTDELSNGTSNCPYSFNVGINSPTGNQTNEETSNVVDSSDSSTNHPTSQNNECNNINSLKYANSALNLLSSNMASNFPFFGLVVPPNSTNYNWQSCPIPYPKQLINYPAFDYQQAMLTSQSDMNSDRKFIMNWFGDKDQLIENKTTTTTLSSKSGVAVGVTTTVDDNNMSYEIKNPLNLCLKQSNGKSFECKNNQTSMKHSKVVLMKRKTITQYIGSKLLNQSKLILTRIGRTQKNRDLRRESNKQGALKIFRIGHSLFNCTKRPRKPRSNNINYLKQSNKFKQSSIDQPTLPPTTTATISIMNRNNDNNSNSGSNNGTKYSKFRSTFYHSKLRSNNSNQIKNSVTLKLEQSKAKSQLICSKCDHYFDNMNDLSIHQLTIHKQPDYLTDIPDCFSSIRENKCSTKNSIKLNTDRIKDNINNNNTKFHISDLTSCNLTDPIETSSVHSDSESVSINYRREVDSNVAAVSLLKFNRVNNNNNYDNNFKLTDEPDNLSQLSTNNIITKTTSIM